MLPVGTAKRGTLQPFAIGERVGFPCVRSIHHPQASTPVGFSSVTVSGTTVGAPGPRARTLSLTVTPPVPDYVLTVANSPLSANVNQSGLFNGSVKSVNGYASSINLSCGTGAPPKCTVWPAPLTPTAGGAPFTVTAQSNLAQTYNFNLNATGTDFARKIALRAPNVLFAFHVHFL